MSMSGPSNFCARTGPNMRQIALTRRDTPIRLLFYVNLHALLTFVLRHFTPSKPVRVSDIGSPCWLDLDRLTTVQHAATVVPQELEHHHCELDGSGVLIDRSDSFKLGEKGVSLRVQFAATAAVLADHGVAIFATIKTMVLAGSDPSPIYLRPA